MEATKFLMLKYKEEYENPKKIMKPKQKLYYMDYLFSFKTANDEVSSEGVFDSTFTVPTILWIWFQNNNARYFIDFDDTEMTASDLVFLYDLLKDEENIIIATPNFFIVVNELPKNIEESIQEKYGEKLIINEKTEPFNLGHFNQLFFQRLFNFEVEEEELFELQKDFAYCSVFDEKLAEKRDKIFEKYEEATNTGNNKLLKECQKEFVKFFELWTKKMIKNPKVWIGCSMIHDEKDPTIIKQVVDEEWFNLWSVLLFKLFWGLGATKDFLFLDDQTEVYKRRCEIDNFLHEWSKKNGKM